MGSIASPGLRLACHNAFIYAAAGSLGLQIIDAREPSNPTNLGYYDTGGEAMAVVISENLAFIADASGGLQIADVSDPGHPSFVGACSTQYASALALAEHYVYFGTYDPTPYCTLGVIEISNPRSPELLGRCRLAGDIWSLKVSGHLAFAGVPDSGLQIIDVSDPNLPVPVARHDNLHVRGLAFEGGMTIISEGGLLRIMSFNDPVMPVVISTYNCGGEISDLRISGDFLYIANTSDGLKVLDVSDITNIKLTAKFQNVGNASFVYWESDYIYLSDSGWPVNPPQLLILQMNP
jgi:hypothetical protein